MRKFVATMCLAVGLATVPGVASALPIGTNQCAIDATTGLGACDIFADYASPGASALGLLEGNLGGYLLGYTFLLNQAADLSDGFQAGDVAHILVIHDTLFELFSNTVFNIGFDDVFTAASTGASIDGISPSVGQLAGCPPVISGVPNLGGVGYCTTADVVSVYANWGLPTGEGGQDLLTIHTALDVVEPPPPPPPPPDPSPVPEPGTLTLLALGGSGALASRWRRRRTATDA
ncbi:MAG: PEP-CTERM sorting domain-containing protein [Vicinamibacterales bacterium]